MDTDYANDARPPPAQDAWIILASYVRQTWFQLTGRVPALVSSDNDIQVLFTLLPFALVFLLAARVKSPRHTF
ncbi:hypothetical protein BBBOND_0403400 [Babesia bigemina]|uniref:Uncharacterized protein n=1 Tax=Babesia bigemina TaxID=5866 RepID=A0A061DCL4_BABBI|nr:hypothetical protein BBBOND_0403400 [Babesia bigemina]CDR97852.1 hypothetical protein BBBOND_0403400 [Babesia bigemina]|eukprot:XP_012770038.1 hypothetical protein BBBOND_0403400 [Babesia bigemina]